MLFTPHGKHFIAGEYVATDKTFPNKLIQGTVHHFSVGTPGLVNRACEVAEEAFWSYGYTTREERAKFLNTIASEIEARTEGIVLIGTQETGLPVLRLQGECGRTIGQLRLFASHILAGDYLDRRHDKALPDRSPLPRPDIRLIQRPIGPVAVFGSSNFPLAFSTAGGDTAAALAAGCPVVVKGHEAHPGTSEIVAEAIQSAVKQCDIHRGVFSLVQGGTPETGQTLVQHPRIKAVGFTGSLTGGRALFNFCAARPEPIPFYGELGSVNPVFTLPQAINSRSAEIAHAWITSLIMGTGQFCTNPGVLVLIESEITETFIESIVLALKSVGSQVMLTEEIASAYRAGRGRMSTYPEVRELLTSFCDKRNATPSLFATTGKSWLENAELGKEIFGPLGLIITVTNMDELLQVARSLEGQITCTIHMDKDDISAAKKLLPILERKAGRILINDFPTGVEVCDAMIHGGPYPASTNFGATSVGTMSIRRFLRPVSYQNFPDELIPLDLHY